MQIVHTLLVVVAGAEEKAVIHGFGWSLWPTRVNILRGAVEVFVSVAYLCLIDNFILSFFFLLSKCESILETKTKMNIKSKKKDKKHYNRRKIHLSSSSTERQPPNPNLKTKKWNKEDKSLAGNWPKTQDTTDNRAGPAITASPTSLRRCSVYDGAGTESHWIFNGRCLVKWRGGGASWSFLEDEGTQLRLHLAKGWRGRQERPRSGRRNALWALSRGTGGWSIGEWRMIRGDWVKEYQNLER